MLEENTATEASFPFARKEPVEWFIETTLEHWSQLFEIDMSFASSFAYRGQADAKWGLASSIERASLDLSKYSGSTLAGEYSSQERWTLHDFKRRYPVYSRLYPSPDDNFEWLAIMQHHGAPTRLLDFSYSIFVAIYFAVIDSTKDAAIWAVDRFYLRDVLQKEYGLAYQPGVALLDEINNCHIDFANSFINMKHEDLAAKSTQTVIPLWPKIVSERLSRQQGLFLMPTDPRSGFYENLRQSFGGSNVGFERWPFRKLIMYSKAGVEATPIPVLRITLPKPLFGEILEYLVQMNITAETLFPGVDGMARSLTQLHIRT